MGLRPTHHRDEKLSSLNLCHPERAQRVEGPLCCVLTLPRHLFRRSDAPAMVVSSAQRTGLAHNGSSSMATMATHRPQDVTCSIEPKLT